MQIVKTLATCRIDPQMYIWAASGYTGRLASAFVPKLLLSRGSSLNDSFCAVARSVIIKWEVDLDEQTIPTSQGHIAPLCLEADYNAIYRF
jgi:hypothetical protein